MPEGGLCTSTLVGDRVLLTAAHCLSAPKTVGNLKLRVGEASPVTTVTCDRFPGYTRNARDPLTVMDFALCVLHDRVRGVNFEVISTAAQIPSPGQRVTLLGYGCQARGGRDRTFGILQVGAATVDQDPRLVARYIGAGGAAGVCSGDSGGAAYVATTTQGGRAIVGVNSRGNFGLDADSNPVALVTYISPTSSTEFVGWLREWAESHNAAGTDIAVCGVHPDARGCRP
jgi:hypothetical protein